MVIPNKYVTEVCKMGSGKLCCRYLILGGMGFECAKKEQSLKRYLDLRVEQGTINATGDNCDGLTRIESYAKLNDEP